MLSSPKMRVVLTILGLVMLGLFIWFAGPLFGFGDSRPLRPVRSRLIMMALVVVCWIAWVLIKRRRANRASDQLMAAVVEQPEASGPSPEAVQLRERFEDAIATLKKQRRSGHSLYDLPWYVIIGAPGSGKTTALLNSGLKFPVKQRTGAVALRGVGGTRDCDWWFTDEAVFLDTAGRYTTQDSDAAADSAGWDEFMALLRKYRKRRPVNGVLLTISAQDLMLQSRAELEAHVGALRRRLDELNQKLHIQLPVYLLVTKCDLVVGFTEYFDDLAQDGRSQVWGVTFPYERTVEGEAAGSFPAEFDALVARLNGRVFARLDEEHEARRRAVVFAFPQQMAALRDVLTGFVSEVFGSTRFDKQILLRGVYLTSGTQEGTPIDRLLGSIGRQFEVRPEAVLSREGQGKAYFIERLLKQVMFAESGLAGVNRRFEVQKAAWQFGAYAAMLLVAVLGVFAFTVSFVSNRNYVTEVGREAAALQNVQSAPATASLGEVLPRLDAVRGVYESANRYRDAKPWGMRWWLFQGDSVGTEARDAYLRELNSALLPRLAARIEQGLTRSLEPIDLYYFFKVYLMLGQPEYLDKEQLGFVASLAWQTGDPATENNLGRHLDSLLEEEESLRPFALDDAVVEQARSTLRLASIANLMYAEVVLTYADAAQGGLRLDLAAGLGTADLLERRSGTPWSEPVPSLYTAPVFKEITGNTDPLAARFFAERWVWSDEGLPDDADPIALGRALVALYEADYIAVWDEILTDIEPARPGTQRETEELLATLGSSTSPLRGLLETIDEQTFLVEPQEEGQSAARDGLGRALQRGIGRAGRLAAGALRGLSEASGPDVPPGTAVTEHFAPIHELVTGEDGNAPIDAFLDQLIAIQQQLSGLGEGIGKISPSDPRAEPVIGQIREDTSALSLDATGLPPAVRDIITQLARLAAGSVPGPAGGLRTRYRQGVVPACQRIVGRYPFVAASRDDVSLAEFGRLFGDGGTYDNFFNQNVERLVDRSRTPWRWRPGAGGGARDMLDQFAAAERIREAFFSAGGSVPAFGFTMEVLELTGPDEHFVLEIGGEALDYLRGSRRPILSLTWPGQSPGITVTFDSSFQEYVGPWAWFRMVDDSMYQEETQARYVLSFQQGGARARVRVETDSTANPFAGATLLRQFRCGS